MKASTPSILPSSVTHYKSTPVFTEKNIPRGLQKNHQTKKGVWGKICVYDGTLLLFFPESIEPIRITKEQSAIVAPEELHHVFAQDSVRFRVEFYRS